MERQVRPLHASTCHLGFTHLPRLVVASPSFAWLSRGRPALMFLPTIPIVTLLRTFPQAESRLQERVKGSGERWHL